MTVLFRVVSANSVIAVRTVPLALFGGVVGERLWCGEIPGTLDLLSMIVSNELGVIINQRYCCGGGAQKWKRKAANDRAGGFRAGTATAPAGDSRDYPHVHWGTCRWTRSTGAGRVSIRGRDDVKTA